MSHQIHSMMTNSNLLGRLAGYVSAARRRHRERLELTRMDERALHDVGLTRATLAYELNKPFWRV